MVSFSTRPIENSLNVGELFRQQREARRDTLEEVSQTINISVKYLQGLEAGDYHKLPGNVYTRSFVRAYAKYLGLDQKQCIAQYTTEQNVYSKTKHQTTVDFTKPVERVSRFNLMFTPRLIRSIGLACLALMCVGYLGLKVKAIVTPPMLIVESPASDLLTQQKFIDIAGKTQKETVLAINGQQIVPDPQGNFRETVDLQTGINLIEISAESRHGKFTKVYRQVVVDDTENKESYNK